MIGNGKPKSITHLLMIRADLEMAIQTYHAALELVTQPEIRAGYVRMLDLQTKNLRDVNERIAEEVRRDRASRTTDPG